MLNLKKALVVLTLICGPILSASASELEVATCYTQTEVKYSVQLTYDVTSKTLKAVILNLADSADSLVLHSDALTVPPKFYDYVNPTLLSDGTNSSSIIFGTKMEIVMPLASYGRKLHCPLYFPERIGMEYR